MADKGYKAFRPGFYCEYDGNRKQYFENSIAEDTGADGCCRQGVMHYCEAPLDTLDYYPLIDDEGRLTEFAEVEPMDEVFSEGNKRATKKLKIGAKLSLKDLITAQVNVVFRKAEHGKLKEIKEIIKKLAASGARSNLAASGAYSIAAAIGRNSIAKAGKGSWIALAEYGKWDGNRYPVLCVKAAQIDGETLKPDIWYKLENGEFVEVGK